MGLELKRCPKVSSSTGIRTVPPEETLARFVPLLQKAGMDPLEDITEVDNIGIPVYSIYRKNTAKGTFGNYNGKGATPEQAKASAVMEAMERYSAEQRESDEVAYGTVGQIRGTGMPFVEPADLILPARIMGMVENADIAWTECYDILRGEEVWVPACAVFYPYYPDGDLQLFRYHTNGIASGNTIEEAILHSMFEVIERDAWSIAESFNRTNADIIVDEDSVPGRLLKQFRDNGVEIKLKDLTSDVGVTTIGASSDDTVTKDPELLTIGVGTHLNPEIAAVRALTEVAQSRTTHKHGLKVNAELQKVTRSMGYEKIKAANRMWYCDNEKKVRLLDMKDESTPYVLDDIEVVLGKLVDAGFDRVVIADLTRPDVNVPTVRSIIPGMEVSTMDSEREGLRSWGRWQKKA